MRGDIPSYVITGRIAMATSAPPVWNRWDILASPAFATLAPLIAQLPEDHFPTLAQLNRMCDEREVVSGNGVPIEFEIGRASCRERV